MLYEVITYEIHDTKFVEYDDKKDEAVKSTLNNLLNQELMNNLVKNLENVITSYSIHYTKLYEYFINIIHH